MPITSSHALPPKQLARAFPGGRAAHPEDQNEEENTNKIEEK